MAVDISLDLYRSVGNNRLESGANPDNVFADGLIYTITGTGFGTRSGYADHIRNTSIFNLPDNSNFGPVGRWNGSSYIGASERFQVVSEGLVGKCLKATRGAVGEPNISLLFSFDAPVPLGSKVFSSAWFKHSVTGSTVGGQWKYSRWQKATNSISDKTSEVMWSGWNSAAANKIQVRNGSNFPSPDNMAGWGPASINNMPHGRNKWVRMDMLHTLPSSYSSPDEYKCEAWVHDPDGLVVPYYTNFTDDQSTEHINPYGQAGDEWLQHIYQNYLGNGDYGNADHTLWMDNFFECVGDNKRVELANNSNLALATKRFIVPEISWSDTTIPVRGYTGGLTGTNWVHVVVNEVSIQSTAVEIP